MNSHDRTTPVPNSSQSDCRAVEDLLVVLSADELESELALQLRAHLEDCANCQKTFADINRARRLAVGLNLESPELDRYAEFLKRLATNEAADSKAELIPFRADKASLIADSDDQGSSPEAGVAAVIPLFGNRLIVRNGFGGGFDLQLKSRQGRELVHVSANSLMKAAVVVGGFGIFAASALFAIGFLIVSYFQKPADGTPVSGEVAQHQQRPFEDQLGKPMPQRVPWIQSVEGRDHKLSVWKAGHQVQAAFFDGRNFRVSKPFILLMPIPPDRQLFEPAITECTVATNAESFVVVREHAGTLFAWHLNPVDEVAGQLSSPPIAIGDRALQPAITWAGDRYLVVWIEPDNVAPKIKLLELGSDGRPLQTVSTTVAETLREGEKVGSPAVIARDGNALIVYQKQGGELMAKIWSDAGLNDAPISIGKHQGILHNRVMVAATEEAFYVCWAAKTGEGIEISFAELGFSGQLNHQRPLLRTRMPVASFDFRAANNRLALLWAEHVAGALQVISQRFALDGQPSGKPVNVQTNSDVPSAVSFADAEGNAVFWHQPAANQSAVTIRPIDWKNGQ